MRFSGMVVCCLHNLMFLIHYTQDKNLKRTLLHLELFEYHSIWTSTLNTGESSLMTHIMPTFELSLTISNRSTANPLQLNSGWFLGMWTTGILSDIFCGFMGKKECNDRHGDGESVSPCRRAEESVPSWRCGAVMGFKRFPVKSVQL